MRIGSTSGMVISEQRAEEARAPSMRGGVVDVLRDRGKPPRLIDGRAAAALRQTCTAMIEVIASVWLPEPHRAGVMPGGGPQTCSQWYRP